MLQFTTSPSPAVLGFIYLTVHVIRLLLNCCVSVSILDIFKLWLAALNALHGLSDTYFK